MCVIGEFSLERKWQFIVEIDDLLCCDADFSTRFLIFTMANSYSDKQSPVLYPEAVLFKSNAAKPSRSIK